MFIPPCHAMLLSVSCHCYLLLVFCVLSSDVEGCQMILKDPQAGKDETLLDIMKLLT